MLSASTQLETQIYSTQPVCQLPQMTALLEISGYYLKKTPLRNVRKFNCL
jgi:hypothetical protein